eukprot:CAMPEP_0196584476 /NCGR_PEP_ID=MMETSP1081-20130531/47156_1 /TAXON_ID=36882 /ORGANISM="Pyramimonas amylifera, Strain CCMP720" /LENGTH=1211 /DNA_ID=CAMNT_0041905687 /DNA_START=221 /DNA_END=3856 /DNA_ORIENTATION=-
MVSRGKILELLRPDDSGKLQIVLSVEIFGQIRSLAAFRLTGAQKDYLVVGSDSGRFVVLEYHKDKNKLEAIQMETFGKSGCRRIVPGQFLAIDPRGRAAMIGACEKQKLVYVFNRDNAANLTISSPLEAHKSHTLVFALCAVDCGFDNPMFAAIELDYSDADQDSSGEAAAEAQKHLTFYELDLGLNHVVRKWTEPVDNGANLLVPVPGGADGPSGVLVCAENFLIYKKENHPDVRVVIPRRADLPGDRGVLLVCHATHKLKNMFFFLLQSEYGDIYKVTVEYKTVGEMETVTEVKMKYFDTIPTCVSICVLKTGFLFAASEFANHALYQFQGIGDGEDDVESSSLTLMETEEGFQPVFFEPRPLRNLTPIDDMPSISPVMDLQAASVGAEETPALLAACGRGPRSSLRVLRQGVSLTEMAVSPLPGHPSAVWTVRTSTSSNYDAYIVVSFANATLVLSIGETVEEVNDSGFLGTTPSLRVGLLGEDSFMQAHPQGLRHIRADRRVNEWKTPGRKTVTQVAANLRQVVLALTGGELVYFEMEMTGQLVEVDKKEMASEIACLDVGKVPEGRQRSRFLAVGSFDNTVRIFSLDPDNCLGMLATQAVAAAPESLLILDTAFGAGAGAGPESSSEETPAATGPDGSSLFLNIGLSNGVLLRTEVDRVTGQLSDTRTRFLGARAPKLFGTTVRGREAMLALSTRPWLGYMDAGRFVLAPLSYEALEYAAPFASQQCPEGMVAIAQSSLRIVTVERLGETFNQTSCKLRYTPRSMAILASSPSSPDSVEQPSTVVVVGSDHACASLAQVEEARVLQKHAQKAAAKSGMEVDGEEEEDEDDDEDEGMTPEEQFGAPKDSEGQWASCIQVVDAKAASVLSSIELEGNEAAMNVCTCSFPKLGPQPVVVVGTVTDLSFYPRESSGGYLHLYAVASDGGSLNLIHKTPIDGIPAAICGFQDKLLVGMGKILRLYDLGKKKLLRKCELRTFPTFITTIKVLGDRIYVGDNQHSLHWVKYRAKDNLMYCFADDVTPRWVTTAITLDYNTVAAGDKFGNLVVCRLPAEVSDEVEEDPTGGKIVAHQAFLNGAPHKLEPVAQFHVGETVLSLTKAELQPGGQEVVVYATGMGGLGALLPFTAREDVDFFSHLELHLRQENPPLCGRDHMHFRSYYFPVKDVIDGDLCEQYATLSNELQRKIADELDRTPSEILKKLEDIRQRIC